MLRILVYLLFFISAFIVVQLYSPIFANVERSDTQNIDEEKSDSDAKDDDGSGDFDNEFIYQLYGSEASHSFQNNAYENIDEATNNGFSDN